MSSAFRKVLLRFRYPLIALVSMALIAFIVVATFAVKYDRAAAKYDLETLLDLERGTAVLDQEGETIGRINIENIRFVGLDEVPQVLVDAIIATEDGRYYSHNGFDKVGIARAAVANFRAGEIKQGGSTITQQLARHAFRLDGRSYHRKALELALARRLEVRFTKDEILERYLNRIYLGSGFYGVGSAARGYFGKEVSDLTLSDSALLAAIIKSPSRFSPFNAPDKAWSARNRTLYRMHSTGRISESDYREAKLGALGVLTAEQRDREPRYVLGAVRREVESDFGRGVNLESGEVRTHLSAPLQRYTIDALRDGLTQLEQKHELPDDTLQGAAIVMDVQTGEIQAMVGGRDYRTQEFDQAMLARQRIGLAMLPLLYGAFYDADLTNFTAEVLDTPFNNARVMVGGRRGTLGEWGDGVKGYRGLVPTALTFAQAKRGAAVRVGNQLGQERFLAFLTAAGVRSRVRPYPGSFLGESSLQLDELVRAYTVFANEGRLAPKPHFIANVAQEHGLEHESRQSSRRESVLHPSAAKWVRNLLIARVAEERFDCMLGQNGLSASGIAGYDGATQDGRHSFFIGMDKDVICAVFVSSTDRSVALPQFPARELALPIFCNIFAEVTDDFPNGWREAVPALSTQNVACLYTLHPAGEGCRQRRTPALAVVPNQFALRGEQPCGCADRPAPPRGERIFLAQQPERQSQRTVVPQGQLVQGQELIPVLQ